MSAAKGFMERGPVVASTCALEDEFDRLALELFALQFDQNAPYRRFCEARGARPGELTHWSQIPAMPTSAFKELELSCLPPGGRTRVFWSSGTTEQRPSRHFHNSESLAVYEASLWPWFAKHVLESGSASDMSLLCLVPSAAEAPNSSLAYMFETVRQKMGARESAFVGGVGEGGGWTLNLEAALAALRQSSATAKPVLLLGTAFSFVHLLDFLAERNLRLELPPGSRALETGGYKGRSRALPKAELHSLLSQQLGIAPSHVVCEYGMSELSSQAYDVVVREGPQALATAALARTRSKNNSMSSSQRELALISAFEQKKLSRLTSAAANFEDAPGESSHPSRAFRFPPWARVQVISPETGSEVGLGETGLIQIYDLANVYSVMGIRTEDLGIRREEGFELIGRAALAEPRGCSLMAI